MSHDEHSHFIVPVTYYVATFIALLFLTFLTVAVTWIDLGTLNIVVALLVAFAKAALVVSVFMGLRWEKGFNRVAFFSSLVFVFIFFLLIYADIAYREKRDPMEAESLNMNSPVKIVDETHHHGKKDSGY